MDMVETYRSALDATAGIVKRVEPGQLALPTPCARYEVRALLNHLVGGFQMWVDMAAGKTVEFQGDQIDVIGDDWAAAYHDGARAAHRAFADDGVLERTFRLPNGADVPGAQALGIALMEAVLHGWDIAKATGQQATIDPAIAGVLLGGLEAMGVPRSEDGHPFGPEVRISKDAPAPDRLLAFLGRKP